MEIKTILFHYGIDYGLIHSLCHICWFLERQLVGVDTLTKKTAFESLIWLEIDALTHKNGLVLEHLFARIFN